MATELGGGSPVLLGTTLHADILVFQRERPGLRDSVGCRVPVRQNTRATIAAPSMWHNPDACPDTDLQVHALQRDSGGNTVETRENVDLG
jgi:hypothetical protein